MIATQYAPLYIRCTCSFPFSHFAKCALMDSIFVFSFVLHNPMQIIRQVNNKWHKGTFYDQTNRMNVFLKNCIREPPGNDKETMLRGWHAFIEVAFFSQYIFCIAISNALWKQWQKWMAHKKVARERKTQQP